MDSLFARGEIPDLFSQEEKHQLNEVVHKFLMKREGGKLSEKTPSELYEIFVEISKVKIHVLLNYNYDNKKAIKMLRTHKSILSNATIINLRRWPRDALQKSAELIFEEVNADRNAKKTVMQIGISIYKRAMYVEHMSEAEGRASLHNFGFAANCLLTMTNPRSKFRQPCICSTSTR